MSRLFTISRSPSRRQGLRGSDAASLAQQLDAALADRRFRALPEELESRFQDETGDNQIRALFRATLASALFYTFQLVAEWALTPDAFAFAAALHFGVVTPVLFLIAAFARAAVTPMRRDFLGAAIPLLIAGQAAATYMQSNAEGAPYYLSLLCVAPILGNSSLPLSSRAALWSSAICLVGLAALTRLPHGGPAHVFVGGLTPISICVAMTLLSAFQRNREARRAYLLDLRHRLRVAEVGQEARHDPLTGLANRRRLEEVAAALWRNEIAHVSPISVVLYDVDRFKTFNDLYGHQKGDECLKRVAACALEEIGEAADAGAHQLAHDLRALSQDAFGKDPDRLAAHAGRIGGAEDGPDRGAGDRDRTNAHFVQRLQNGDMAEPAPRVEFHPVKAGDAHRFLPAMLKRVEPERDETRRMVGVPHAEHAAFLAQLVPVCVRNFEGIGRQHDARPNVHEEPRI